MKALLDSGSSVNYISGSAALRARLRPLQKTDLYQLYIVNGVEMLQNATITHDTIAMINIKGRSMRVHLDIFGLAAHDIILGLPWLKESNPQID
jgi:hypothetical protein